MESMNGFLLHLTKTDRMHDNQLRAWMKKVRDLFIFLRKGKSAIIKLLNSTLTLGDQI
jgi:hypothetical protein